MIATWMLYGTVIAILAGLGALALERGARLLGRAGRWCWVGAMLVTLALPVVAWMYPQRPVLEAAAPTRPTPAVDLAGRVDVVVPVAGALVKSPFDWSVLDRPLAYGWALVSVALLGWFAFGTWRLARMRKSWRWTGDLFVSNDVGPAVIGFVRCQVVVPEWSLALSQEQRDLLLAHEAEHLAAYDSRLLLASAAVLALVPWNPGVWWQFRRLRLAIELDCDQRVLRHRPDAALYGRLLLDVGARTTRTLVPVTAFNEPMSSLEHRIRALTALRPQRPGLWAAGAAVACGIAIFAACEAPRPTAPASKPQAFTMSTHEQVEGVLSSKYIADSVRRYIGMTASKAVFDWFIVSADSHVVRYGTTPRNQDDDVVRSEGMDYVVPGFQLGRLQSITVVAANAMWPGSQPVYWGVLRDPKQISQFSRDGLLSAPRWVTEAMARYYPELSTAKTGQPVEVWFASTAGHEVLQTKLVRPQSVSGVGLGSVDAIHTVFPGLKNAFITSISPGANSGWAGSNVRVVWVTQVASREQSEAEGFGPDTVRAKPFQWLMQSEGNRQALEIPSRQAMLEKGAVVVAEKYPQYLNQRADPPVTVWVVEGANGRILSTHVSKAYEAISDAEMAAEEPQYRQFRPGEWMSWLPLNDQRTDVRVVWVHSNRGR